MTIHVIMACHNRRALTLHALQVAAASAANADLAARFVVYDDGSTDGTAAAIASTELPVVIISGDGNAFWARSMAEAEQEALESSIDNDWIVWLNDDVDLDIDAFSRLALHTPGDTILVGAVRDPATGAITYSGLRRTGWHPLGFSVVQPTTRAEPVDTFNGNLVCVPVRVARCLGGIDGHFAHAWADIDYGLRARKAGFRVVLAPGTYGSCARNIPDTSGSTLTRWRRHRSRKGGGESASIQRLIQRHAPRKWPWAQWSSVLLWWIRETRSALGGSRD